jgi:hypothetical protein
MAVLAVTALASNVSHPATYTGTTATGGTIEFDVSADGTEVTRYAIKGVSMPPCGTFTAYTTDPTVADIVDDAFMEQRGRIYLSGSFPAFQQAQGTLVYHRSDSDNCASEKVAWTATTPTAPPDEVPPETRILSGPAGPTPRQWARLRFIATDAAPTFQCKLDEKPWRACSSPQTYRNLIPGRHVARVKATDAAGNVDPVPAVRRWRVEPI